MRGSLVTRSPIFYGWIILGAASVGLIMSSPGQTYSISIFIEHFITDLGISRSLVSTLYTAGTLIASLGLPYLGRQIDQRGPRVMIAIVTILLAAACVYMGWVQNAVMLLAGFVFLRFLAPGGMFMVSSNEINYWWVRRRGVIMSIAGILMSILGSGSFPSLIHGMIAWSGWRNSFFLLGIMVAAVMLPVGIGLFRQQPEEYGLLPDGDSDVSDPDNANNKVSQEVNWTRYDAVRTPAFWMLSSGIAAIAMLVTGLNFHTVSIFDDAGISAGAAAAVYMPIAISGSLVRLLAGYLIDRISPNYLLSSALMGMTASLLIAPRLSGSTSVLVFGIVMGITGSLNMTVSSVVWAMYFGRRYLGAITGVAALVNVAGSSLGPMPMGIARDIFGDYNLALTTLALIPAVLSIVVLFARKPIPASHLLSPHP